MAQSNLSHIHHYVPEWYQRRFFVAEQAWLNRLDLHPKRVVAANGRICTPRACLRRPPSRCFCTKELYMLRFGRNETDVIERRFFGDVDHKGAPAIELFSGITTFTAEISKQFHPFLWYMGAQRFRTPRGLDWLQATSKQDRQSVLVLLTHLFQAHSTMWMEGVWEIVCADGAETKFIVSDSPVTFYNPALPPSMKPYPGVEELDKVATRTIFPLSLTRCLIITHTQYVRSPHIKPLIPRTNARSFQQAMFKFDEIQIGRQLSDDEVVRLNYILKMSASRFIAAGREEWLYPERQNRKLGWASLDKDWFMMPDPWRVSFTTEIRWGGPKGAWSLDAYGRQPFDPQYRDEKQHDREWVSAERTKREWARKRKNAPRSRTMERHDFVNDQLIDDYLQNLWNRKRPARQSP